MERKELAPKVIATYQAVIGLLIEGADVNSLTVSEITGRAGIGKGTVYDYFSNKEDMIAGALFYEIEVSCRELYNQIREKESLYDKMNLILGHMEEQVAEISCFVKVLHLLMDNSAVGCKLRERIKNKDAEQMLIEDLIRQMLKEEIKDTGKLPEGDMSYLVMTILSRMICFALYKLDELNRTGLDCAAMREMICRDVCRSVEGYRGNR